MDNFGIFDFLSGLNKFYQENKTDFVSTTDKTDSKKPETMSATSGEQSKQENDNAKTQKIPDIPTVYLNQKLLEVITRHDDFVKRVNDANPPKPIKKKVKRQQKTTPEKTINEDSSDSQFPFAEINEKTNKAW